MGALLLDTLSGLRIDLAAPSPETIDLLDIARPLSRLCRFGGQTLRFHSVAQHAVLVHDRVLAAGHPELALAALHHDSHEAYTGDLPSPVKRFCEFQAKGPDQKSKLEQLADSLDAAISSAFGFVLLTAEQKAIVKRADNEALWIEARELLANGGLNVRTHLANLPGFDEASLDALPALADSLPPEEAEEGLIAAHHAARLSAVH